VNKNCLEGVECPSCGYEDAFFIAAHILVKVTDDGTDDTGSDYVWDWDSYCQCCDCDHEGVLKDFHKRREDAI